MVEGQVFVRLVRNGNKMKKIAITGNMGSGKSYATRCIEKYGVFVLDMDEVAKDVRLQNTKTIIEMLGINEISEIATCVFQNDEKRVLLEQFMYPLMIEKMKHFFNLHEKERLVVVEIALVFEKGWEHFFDEVWCVYCDEEVALARLCNYRSFTKEQALARLNLQMDGNEKKQRSQIVLYNNEEDDLQEQIRTLLKKEGILC